MQKSEKADMKNVRNLFFFFFLSFINLVLIVFDGIVCIESIFRICKLKPVVFEI